MKLPKGFKTILLSTIILLVLYILLLIFPKTLFGYEHYYKQFNVFSDKPINIEIDRVLEKVELNLAKSELYNDDDNFNIYVCHETWRLLLFTRHKSIGGQVNFPLSGNVFIRECSIADDKIIAPQNWKFSLSDRPLSYFITHELTHTLQRKISPFLIYNLPDNIVEGYADYIAKGKSFNFIKYRQEYLNKKDEMNPRKGLYKLYHLYMAYLIEKKGLTFKEIIKQKPPLQATLAEIKLVKPQPPREFYRPAKVLP